MTADGRRYTRERLAAAAACCGDIEAAVAFLGAEPNGHLTRYLMRRFAHFDIDVSHFPPFGRDHRPSTAELRDAIASSCSFREVLRRLGRKDNESQHANLKKWVADDDLSTAHFLGQSHQRGKRSPSAKRPDEILVRRDTGGRTSTRTLRRALREAGAPDQCAGCGVGSQWHGKPMTLEIDHVNGDRSDDRRENLRLLCPNCHAVTSTWCRGGKRHQPI
ncbi:HNH endonuclease signature motif containing protein [Streptomyces sp. NPDC007325]|uniref:HNH endonuclease signature motif containing protein n=1 Tax=Streptomyces sp. NPDC007325 TaxID=3154588 RepID=UPI0034018DEE